MSDYYPNCECCNKEVHIQGGYIGTFDDVYCLECGFGGEYCNTECQNLYKVLQEEGE